MLPKRPRLEPVLSLQMETLVLAKKVQSIKQNVLYFADKWGQQFPTRLVASSLQYLTSEEAARAYTTSKQWETARGYMDAFWRERYVRDWEIETALDYRIANKGPSTPWYQRYKRRAQTEQNLRAGKFRKVQLPIPKHFINDGLIFLDRDGKPIVVPFIVNRVYKDERIYERYPGADPVTTKVAYGHMVLADDNNITCLDTADLSLKFHRPTRYRSDRIQVCRNLVLSASFNEGIEVRRIADGSTVLHYNWPAEFEMTAFVYDEHQNSLYVCGLVDHRQRDAIIVLRQAISNTSRQMQLDVFERAKTRHWRTGVLLLDEAANRLLLFSASFLTAHNCTTLKMEQEVKLDESGYGITGAYTPQQMTRTAILACSMNRFAVMDRKSLRTLSRDSTVYATEDRILTCSPLEILTTAAYRFRTPELQSYDFTPL